MIAYRQRTARRNPRAGAAPIRRHEDERDSQLRSGSTGEWGPTRPPDTDQIIDLAAAVPMSGRTTCRAIDHAEQERQRHRVVAFGIGGVEQDKLQRDADAEDERFHRARPGPIDDRAHDEQRQQHGSSGPAQRADQQQALSENLDPAGLRLEGQNQRRAQRQMELAVQRCAARLPPTMAAAESGEGPERARRAAAASRHAPSAGRSPGRAETAGPALT